MAPLCPQQCPSLTVTLLPSHGVVCTGFSRYQEYRSTQCNHSITGALKPLMPQQMTLADQLASCPTFPSHCDVTYPIVKLHTSLACVEIFRGRSSLESYCCGGAAWDRIAKCVPHQSCMSACTLHDLTR